MVATRTRDLPVPSPLDHLRELPFIRDVAVTQEESRGPNGPTRLVKLRTPRRTFTLALETKGSFLDRTLTNATIAEHAALVRERRLPLLLAARYVPRPTGERLAEAGVNFVDRPGNIHLKLGDDYHVLLLGRRATTTEPTARRPGPALIQLCFTLLADSAASDWSVRALAEAAGIGKTAAATGLQRFIRLGMLTRGGERTYRVADRARLVDDFLSGYAQVLRPHLQLGRFRGPERDPDVFLNQVARAAKDGNVQWAVTGGPAAYALDRFYRGEDVPLFVDHFPQSLPRTLRLVSDRQGPVTVLRAFGRRWRQESVDDTPIAHPWLIYAELLHSGEPRALEAAEQIRNHYLKV
jgi:hypothetical protein